mgnify:FL=1|tara:strand:+ start:154 stop:3444 length:3291 start_codon:yes stop_codon:yes gene_type:complete
MGVKVKTPTPFVGAGQIGTVTPDLTSGWGSLVQTSNNLLNQRFEDRKNKAIEAGELAGKEMITYDNDGNLQSLASLPQGDTYYEQSLKNSAKISFANSLNSDVRNFAEKTLQDNPYDPEKVTELMSIYSESAYADLAPELNALTKEIVNDVSNTAILKARGNKILEDKRIRINENISFLEKTIIDSENDALLLNKPLNKEIEKLFLEAQTSLNADGKEGFNAIDNKTRLNNFKSNILINQKMFSLNTILSPYSGISLEGKDKVENAKLFQELSEKIFNFNKTTLNSLNTAEEKELFNKKTNAQIELFYNKENTIATAINKLVKAEQAVNYATYLNNTSLYQSLDQGSIDKENIYNKLKWTLDPNSKEYKQKIAEKEITIEQAYAIGTAIRAEVGTERLSVLNRDRSDTLTQLGIGDITLREFYLDPKKEHLLNGPGSDEFYAKINNFAVAQYKTLVTELKTKQKNNNAMLTVQINSNLSDWIHMEGGPFSYKTNLADTFTGLTSEFPQLSPSEIQSIINEKEAQIKSFNTEKKHKTELINVMENGGVPSKEAVKYILNKNDITNSDVLQESASAVTNQFNSINLGLNTWQTPLGESIKDISNIPVESLKNLIPLIGDFLRGNEEQQLFFTKKGGLDARTQIWIKNFDTALNNSISGGNIGEAKQYADEQQIINADPDKGKRQKRNFLGIFETKKNPNPTLLNRNRNSLNNSPELGILGDINIPQFLAKSVKGIDNLDDLPEHMNTIMENLFDSNEGIASWTFDQFWPGLNEKRARAIIEEFKDYKIENFQIPQEILGEAITLMKHAYSVNPDIYENDPVAVEALIIKSTLMSLEDYVPTAIPMVAGMPDKGHSFTWRKQSIVNDANKTFKMNNSISSNAQITAEIQLMFNDDKMNSISPPIGLMSEQDLKEGKNRIFTPQDFGEENFFDVRFTTRFIGKNENGENEYQIGYIHGEDGDPYFLSIENADETRSPVIFNYSYEKSYYASIMNDLQDADRNSPIYKFMEDKLPGLGLTFSEFKNYGLRLFDNPNAAEGIPRGMASMLYQWHYSKQDYKVRGENLKKWGEGTFIDLAKKGRLNAVQLLKEGMKQNMRIGR